MASWDAAAAAARGLARRGRARSAGPCTCRTRTGPAEEYARELLFDLVVHTWDLARAIEGDEKIDPGLVDAVYSRIEPEVDSLAASGLFDPPVPVPADADEQTRLIAATGRQP